MLIHGLDIRSATPHDVPVILDFIKALADYEKLSDEVTATEEALRSTLFGEKPVAEVVIGYDESGIAAGFALFFHNYSTFLAKQGMYLEDLFVKPEYRGRGFGKALLVYLARLAQERNCGRLEWSVLDWNTPAIEFYKSLGAKPMDEWTVFRITGDALETLAKA
ncbi:MAG: GNAT family N-acetyltransferase [Candidatus Kapabacteria bacterium]|jgi:GNAT superfamily N-acetyltransferase|nr:GNAT family N-acetyltransferase [Candidatus Kapabacteria bacterium]